MFVGDMMCVFVAVAVSWADSPGSLYSQHFLAPYYHHQAAQLRQTHSQPRPPCEYLLYLTYFTYVGVTSYSYPKEIYKSSHYDIHNFKTKTTFYTFYSDLKN